MAKTSTPTPDHIWQALDTHYTAISPRTLRQNFTQDPARFAKFSAQTDGIFLRLFQNQHGRDGQNPVARPLLHANDFTQKRADMFIKCIKINKTEDRAVLHTALRTFGDTPIMFNNTDIMPALNTARDTLFAFADSIRSGAITAVNKTPFHRYYQHRYWRFRPWPVYGNPRSCPLSRRAARAFCRQCGWGGYQ